MSLESPLRFAPIAKAAPHKQTLSTPTRPKAAPASGQPVVNAALIGTTLGALGLSAFTLNKLRQFPAKIEQALEKKTSPISKNDKASILQQSLNWIGAITGITGTGLSAIALARKTVDTIARDNAADAQESVLALNRDLNIEIQGIKDSL